jgi:SnoaL-like domain
MTALDPFLAAMRDHDIDALAATLADDIEMRSPILPEPLRGKGQVMAVLDLIFAKVDGLAYGELLTGTDRHALTLSARVGEHDIEGVELFRVDADGLIDQVTVTLRPLPALVALQNVVAPAIGAPALELTPR